jgi:hypothetical protein
MRKAPAAFLTLVVAATGFAIAGDFIHPATVSVAVNVADQVEEGFKRAVQRVRPTLPKRVDEATTLTGVSNAGAILTYHYVIDSDNYELMPNFMQTARRRAVALACNTEDTKAAMEAGGTYEFNYSDRKFQSVGGFVVTSADCR